MTKAEKLVDLLRAGANQRGNDPTWYFHGGTVLGRDTHEAWDTLMDLLDDGDSEPVKASPVDRAVKFSKAALAGLSGIHGMHTR